MTTDITDSERQFIADIFLDSVENIGRHLREAREANGQTLEDAAVFADIKDSTAKNIESGTPSYSIDNLWNYAVAVGLRTTINRMENRP